MKIPVKTEKDDDKVTEVSTPAQQPHEADLNSPDPEADAAHVLAAGNDEEDLPEAPEAAAAAEKVGISEGEAAQVCPENQQEDEVTRLTGQLHAKEQEAKEQYDARLRLQAEFENYKKRQEKEWLNFRKYAHETLLQDIIPVIDDFERAIAAAEQTHKLEDFLKGIELIFTKFLDVLQKKGVKEIEAAVGQPFNPEMHEAVTQMESDDIEEGGIVQVFQKGYYLHDRVLRATKVSVAKAKEG